MVKIHCTLLFLCLFLGLGYQSARADIATPPKANSEASLTRAALRQDGLLHREYDLTGHRGYWVDGISVMGEPDAEAPAMGLAEPGRRLPTGFSGLYGRDAGYARYGLALNASQGTVLLPVWQSPIDTPQTSLVWERYGFEGNSFHLDFRRLLTDSIALDLGVASHSTSSSGDFNYQDIVHQTYTGTLKRDSSRVPFTGRNLAFSTMHIQPSVTWYFPRSSLSLQTHFLSIDNDDASRHLFVKDSVTYSSIDWLQDPWNVQVDATSYGFQWRMRPNSRWELEASHRFAYQTLDYADLPPWLLGVEKRDTSYVPKGDSVSRDTVIVDSVFFGDEAKEEYASKSGELGVRRLSPLNPSLRLEYEFLDARSFLNAQAEKQGTRYQDRQTGWVEVSDTLEGLKARAQAGLQRNGSVENEVDYAPAFMLDADMRITSCWSLYGAWQHDTRFPDVTETHVMRTGRLALPNPALRPETRERREGRAKWDAGGVYYLVGLRSESAENAIVPAWVTQSTLEHLSAKEAFQWANLDHTSSTDWFFRAGFRIGNWELAGERGAALSRTRRWDVANRYYKGSLAWKNRFVQDRLGVSVRWDAQWFGPRYDYALNSKNVAIPDPLRNYLGLDFEARMQIQSFSLYTRIDNMNHSLQEPGSGYAPEGITFRYGIQWGLSD